MSMLPAWALVAVLAFVSLSYATQSETPLVQVSGYTASVAAAAEPGGTTGARAVTAAPGAVLGPASAPPAPALRAASDRLSVMRAPSIDVATIRRVLNEYQSPAAGEAQAMYDLGLQYGIDPAICLAFFIVESSAGTRGMATETRSVGNIRATPGYVNHRGYRKYATWREGIEDWYQLITRLYVGEWNLTTVEAIVPVYAPAADNNEPSRYISTVRRLVNQWRASR